MLINAKQENGFQDAILPRDMLDNAIDWIAKNLSPENVFTEKDLEQWAEENGWTR